MEKDNHGTNGNHGNRPKKANFRAMRDAIDPELKEKWLK
jgi:hypothetical protein